MDKTDKPEEVTIKVKAEFKQFPTTVVFGLGDIGFTVGWGTGPLGEVVSFLTMRRLPGFFGVGEDLPQDIDVANCPELVSCRFASREGLAAFVKALGEAEKQFDAGDCALLADIKGETP